MVQVATWNDFGEGTCVEPAREDGYRYLEAIQDARRRFNAELFPYRPDDLRLPLRIYGLRKRLARSSPGGKTLHEAVDHLFAAEVDRALKVIEGLERAATQPSPGAK